MPDPLSDADLEAIRDGSLIGKRPPIVTGHTRGVQEQLRAVPGLLREIDRLRAELAASLDFARRLAERCEGQSEALRQRAER